MSRLFLFASPLFFFIITFSKALFLSSNLLFSSPVFSSPILSSHLFLSSTILSSLSSFLFLYSPIFSLLFSFSIFFITCIIGALAQDPRHSTSLSVNMPSAVVSPSYQCVSTCKQTDERYMIFNAKVT